MQNSNEKTQVETQLNTRQNDMQSDITSLNDQIAIIVARSKATTSSQKEEKATNCETQSHETDNAFDKESIFEHIARNLCLPVGDKDDIFEDFSDSESEGDNETASDPDDELTIQQHYDEIIKKHIADFKLKKKQIEAHSIRYTYKPIPEEEKTDCLPKTDMKKLLKKLRTNYRNNNFIDQSKSKLQSCGKLKQLIRDIEAIRSGNYVIDV